MAAITFNTAGGVSTAAQLRQHAAELDQLTSQLASGRRFARANTDIASLSIATGLLSDAAIYRTYNQELGQASSLIQISDGGLSAIQEILQRMQEIATQAHSGSLTPSDRGYLNQEYYELLLEIDRIAERTNFNEIFLLRGGKTEVTVTTPPTPPPPTPNNPPVLSTPLADQVATEAAPFSYTIPAGSFTDPDGDPLTYSATLADGSPLPGFLSFNAGSQTFSGTPPVGSAGTYSITVTASDPEPVGASDTFDLVVNPAVGLTLNGTLGDDTLTGGGLHDTINGLTGTDSLTGGAGDDTISLVHNTTAGGTLPVTANLVLHMDATNTADITTHPGVVSTIQDQSSANNDITSDTGAVQSGTDTINGLNSLTFGGGDILGVGDTNQINTSAQDQRSVFVAFETGGDITSRQTIYEQGGGVNGFSIYIEGGQLYVGAWRGNGGTFSLYHSAPIAANSTNVAGFVFDASGAGNFTGYLNGGTLGTLANTTAQASHPGDIGIGGVNNNTRYQSGSFGSSGEAFTGEIAELVNYQGAVGPGDATTLQNYFLNKYTVPPTQDTVEGGAGNDTVFLTNDPVALTLDGAAGITGAETISLVGNNNNHDITVENGIFAGGSGVEGGVLVIDNTGVAGDLSLDAALINSNLLDVLGGGGDDTVTGAGNSNVRVSYRNQGAVDANLFGSSATGNGNDTLIDIRFVEGSTGNDTLSGSGDADTLQGGDGNDILRDVSIPPGAITNDNLVLFLDSLVTGDITGHPGNVSFINDQSAFNNDVFPSAGTVQSGVDTINGLNSLTFSNSSLTVGDTNDINLQSHDERSFFMSFETGADVTSRQVLYEEGGTVNGFNMYIEGGRLYVGAYRDTGGGFDIFHSTPIAPNSTNIAGFVFDQPGSGSFDGYLNGAQFGSSPVALDQKAHPGDIGIGGMVNDSRFHTGSESGSNHEFTGELGELLVYRDVLSSSEITDVTNALFTRRLNVSGGNDTFTGGAGDDSLTGDAGDDTLRGGSGDDIAFYSGNIADYTITNNGDGTYTVVDTRGGSPDGTDLVEDIETLSFADGTVPLQTNFPPVLAAAGPFSVSELASNGFVLGNVSATDPDPEDTITYSIEAGNTGNVFGIDPVTGEIFVNNNSSLDFETVPNYTLTIRATDDGTGMLFDEAPVDINVTDEPESGPPPPPVITETVIDEITFQAQLDPDERITVPIFDLRLETFFEDALPNVLTPASAREAFDIVEGKLDEVASFRAELGGKDSQVAAASAAAAVSLTNVLSAEAALGDTDIAEASTDYATRLAQYTIAALVGAQTNRLYSDVITRLLEGANSNAQNGAGAADDQSNLIRTTA